MNIGFFEAGLPNSSHDAGSTAVVELCALLRSMGHDVTYVYTGENPWGREDDLQKLHITTLRAPADRIAFLRARSYDAIIISRPGPAAQWLSSCEQVRVPIIYFGHDIHHVRLKRGNHYLPETQRTNMRDLAAMQLLEQHIWKAARVSVYPSQEECDVVNAYCGRVRALALPLYDLQDFVNEAKKGCITEEKHSLLFVGGAHHAPNEDAMRWFIGEVLPCITIPCKLHIAGDWPEHFIRAHPQAAFLGRLSQEELYAAYYRASLVIAPLRYGAGVKRKVVEALSLGKPVLSTVIGFEGIDLPETLVDALCADVQPLNFASKLERLLHHPTDVLPLKQNIISHYNHHYRKQVLEEAFTLL